MDISAGFMIKSEYFQLIDFFCQKLEVFSHIFGFLSVFFCIVYMVIHIIAHAGANRVYTWQTIPHIAPAP